MPSLEDLYGSFGSQVVETLRQEIATSGDLSAILSKLNMPVPASLSAQHEALRSFIFQFGVGFFLVILKSNWTPEELERQKAQRIAATVRPSAIGGALVPPVKPPANSSPPQQTPVPISPTVVYVTAPPSPPNATPAPIEEPVQEVVMVDTPEYKGPERRSGVERRVGPPDRRSQLVAVNRNRRYGGKDRRKITRRACDREKLEKKS